MLGSRWPLLVRAALVGAAALVWGVEAQAQQTYANLVEIRVKELANAVQISLVADGYLESGSSGDEDLAELWAGVTWVPEGTGGGQLAFTSLPLVFSNARSAIGKSFVVINQYPVSHVLVRPSRQAAFRQGVGLVVTVVFFRPSPVSVEQSGDGQSWIITVTKPFTEGKERELGPRPGRETRVEYERGQVRVHTVETPLGELLREIGEEAGLRVVVDAGISNVANLNLPPMPADEALMAIGTGYGLACGCKGDVYYFGRGTLYSYEEMVKRGIPAPYDLSTYLMSETRTFPVQHLSAGQAATLLPRFLLSYLALNEPANSLTMTGPRSILDKLGEDLQRLDVSVPQTMVEVLVVETVKGALEDLRLDMSWRNAHTVLTSQPVVGEISYQSVGALPQKFDANLTSLQEKGLATVVAKARLVVSPPGTFGAQAGSLSVGEQQYIQVERYGGVGVVVVPVGLQLSVGAMPTRGGLVRVDLQVQVSNVIARDPVKGLPTLASRRARTSIRVKDGETIVIGGLTQTGHTKTHRKMPFLGDLPLVGWLFRSSEASTQERELLVFLTPRVLTDEGRLPDDEEDAIRERFLGEAADAHH